MTQVEKVEKLAEMNARLTNLKECALIEEHTERRADMYRKIDLTEEEIYQLVCTPCVDDPTNT
jgi:hypothetical protein